MDIKGTLPTSNFIGTGRNWKTALCAKLAKKISGEFDYVIWRSLRFVQSPQDLLVSLIQFLSNQQVVKTTDLPKSLNSQILRLLKYLKSSRCLLVLDDAESILQDNVYAGLYREGCEEYGEIFKRLGESSHQSCLILTGHDMPEEVVSLEGTTLPIRFLRLTGLEEKDAEKLLMAKGLACTDSEIGQLIELYQGHPLALKIIATSIKVLFDSDISEFLRQKVVVFNQFRKLLDQQFDRLTDLEKRVMYWIAISQEPVSLSELHDNLVPNISKSWLLETLESLLRRSLIEQIRANFTQQPIVMEYMANRANTSKLEENSS
jgi:chromosome segregation and condensation protein ScpB